MFSFFKKNIQKGCFLYIFFLTIFAFHSSPGHSSNDLDNLRNLLNAAEKGDAQSQLDCGILLLKGESTPEDQKKAFEWVKRAAEQGHALAQYHLAIMYTKGQGVQQDYQKARHWLLKAVDQKHQISDPALRFLTYLYCKNKVEPLDYQKAFEWTLKLTGKYFETIHIDIHHNDKKESKTAITNANFNNIQSMANKGDPVAQFMLGMIYCRGEDVGRDHQKAIKWFKKASEQNYIDAFAAMAFLYKYGKGLNVDNQKAFEWLKNSLIKSKPLFERVNDYVNKSDKENPNSFESTLKKAKDGNADSQASIGKRYYFGLEKGVQQNYQKAFEWLAKATKGGSHLAMFLLADLYIEGKGTHVNKEKALKLLKKLSEEGYAPAQYHIGRFYSLGYGVPINYKLAAELYKKASKADLSPLK